MVVTVTAMLCGCRSAAPASSSDTQSTVSGRAETVSESEAEKAEGTGTSSTRESKAEGEEERDTSSASENKAEGAEETGASSASESETKSSGETANSSTGGSADKTDPEEADTIHTKDVFAMDTYMSLGAYGSNGEKAVEAGEQEIYRLDALLSTGQDTSEVAEINKNGGGTLSADGIALMKESLELYKETDGRFDISIYPVMDLWGFTTEDYKVPTDTELAEALSKVDASKIEFDENTGNVSFGIDGMEIDFGGIAKGYTSSRLMEIYRENGVTSGLVNLGGNVQVIGAKPDGSAWRVAIENPDEDGTYLGIAQVVDQAVITSGGYERYFKKNGKTYHHIIDPSTGYPAESGLISATVICPNGTLADGLSTSLFIMGEETAEEFWRAHQDEFQMILETNDKELYVTEGLKDSFTSDYTIHYISAEG